MSDHLQPDQAGRLARAESRWLAASADRLHRAAAERRSVRPEMRPEKQPDTTPARTKESPR